MPTWCNYSNCLIGLREIQYTWQPGSVLMFRSYYLRLASLDTLFLFFKPGSKLGFFLNLFLNFFARIKAFVLKKLLL